jgi:hypothetical protein
MKIGMIFECGPKGADPKVYEYLAKQLRQRELNPKDVLYRIFQTNGCRKYEDLKDAEKMIKLVKIERLRDCSSFVRFEMKILL